MGAASANGEEKKASSGSAELERIKKLAGKWAGKHGDPKGGMTDISVEYTVVAGGSAVMERVFSGTPMEMVTMYHDDKKGRLTLTHYCMLQNQPKMAVTAAKKKSISFELTKENNGLKDPNEQHRHALTINFLGDDEIEHHWTLYDKGKPNADHSKPFKLKRVKSAPASAP